MRGLIAVLEAEGLAGTAALTEALGIFDSTYDALRLFPAVSETIAELSAIFRLGIISNAEGAYQREKIGVLGIARHFQTVVISGEVGYRKPDPRIFHYALDVFGVRADEALFVGDRLDVDIAGAKAAGMKAVWFNHWGGVIDRGGPQPDAIMTGFADLPRILDSV